MCQSCPFHQEIVGMILWQSVRLVMSGPHGVYLMFIRVIVHKGQLFITCTSTKIKFIVQIHIHVLKIEVTIHNGNIKPILAYKMEWKFHSGIITSKTLDTPLTCPWPLGVTNNEPHILIMKNKTFLLWVTNPFSYHEYQIYFPTMNIEPFAIMNNKPFFLLWMKNSFFLSWKTNPFFSYKQWT